ncbi:branched-chain amino acid ABC transporter permease [Tropheryma whipplei]|uniref:branched-chain amino acid ABC transporter permease n=1 Tax=Tropheryma whipplei TaxID=2039 RepID=UPI000000C7D1|nr:branched-chain amino acid ABC transporter permease [Tropheryma whipplei]CAD66879.1 putative ABC transporter branched chain amino acid transport permease [Tropheryma whipplei TW08/27]
MMGFLSSVMRWWKGMSRPQQWFFLLPFVVLVYLLPIINPPVITTEPGNNFPISLFTMAIYALAAVGLNVVVGYAGLLDLGYIAFFAVGAYVSAVFTSPDSPYVKIPYLWTIPVAIFTAMVFGAALGVPTLRLRGDYLAIVTLGFGEIVRIMATVIPALRGNLGFSNVGHPPGDYPSGQPIFTPDNGVAWYWVAITVVIFVLVIVGNLERSIVGRNWFAICQDEDAAEVMGVNTFSFKVWAFAIGAAIGGLSGSLQAAQTGFVNNQRFDVATSVLFLVAVVLGGSGNKFGAAIGGALVAYIPLRFTEIAQYKYLIFGVCLILLMLFRHEGLFPMKANLFSRQVLLRKLSLRHSPDKRASSSPSGS